MISHFFEWKNIEYSFLERIKSIPLKLDLFAWNQGVQNRRRKHKYKLLCLNG